MEQFERELRALGRLYRRRDEIVIAAIEAGMPGRRIAEISGLGYRTITRIAEAHKEGSKE